MCCLRSEEEFEVLTKRAFSVASSVAFLAFAASSQAIVWRHDIPESTVLSFGNDARFLGIGRVTVGGGVGTGTFLGVNSSGQAWGLSAKHVISTGQTGTFSFESGATFSIVQAIGFAGHDVSVFRMSSFSMPGVILPGLNNNATVANGTLIDGAGYGLHAPQGGSQTLDNKRRGMQSRVDATEVINFGGELITTIRDRFLAPTDPNVRPIQAFGAAGDSGHPLFDPGNNIIGVLSGGQVEVYNNLNWYSMITPALRTQIINATGVPEPATMAVLGLGIAALARKRRQKSTN